MNAPNASETLSSQPNQRSRNLGRLRRFILVMIGLITLIAAFYAIEDWRGKRAWQECKRELQSRGVTIDWSLLAPPAVPDDQNFFKAPHMADWFVGRGATDLSKRLAAFAPTPNLSERIADIVIVPTNNNPAVESNDGVVAANDPDAPSKINVFLRPVLGKSLKTSQLWTIVVASWRRNPVRLFIQSDSSLDQKKFETLFGKYFSVFLAKPGTKVNSPRDFRIEPTGENKFRLLGNNSPIPAADYLKWSDKLTPDFQLIREALKRPYARMDGDYSDPIAIPIPNFITLRSISQVVIARAQCYMLLNQPDKALDELTLVHDLCRICEGRPSGKPMTLVAAMIDVAIQGIYAGAVADGLRLHLWRDADLQALQTQLADVHLLPLVGAAFQSQQASMPHNFEMRSQKQIAEQLKIAWKNSKGIDEELAALKVRYGPRGWLDQNLITFTRIQQRCVQSFDLNREVISPLRIKTVMFDLGTMKGASWYGANPYTFLVAMIVPNYIRAFENMARNQTEVDLACVACALERYHLAHHEYPETLNALIPQFADHLPHDIINGQPLHYHRTEDSQFKLYSVGWNEKDDGGTPGDNDSGDWVWQYPL
jgi:hypothetical protein